MVKDQKTALKVNTDRVETMGMSKLSVRAWEIGMNVGTLSLRLELEKLA